MISAVGLNNYATHDQSRYPELWRGCVGAWAPCLGPTGGRLFDFSRNQNWGTLTNMDNATDWVVSDGRYALDFDGVNDFVSINALRLPSTQSPWTVSLWEMPTAFSVGNFGTSISWGTTGGISFQSVILANNGVGGDGKILIGQFGRDVLTTTTPRPLNTWTHTAMSYSGTVLTAYQNGFQNGSTTPTAFSITPTAASIGRLQEGGQQYTGRIDDIRIYNRALFPAEIRLLATRRGIAYEPARRRRIPQTVAAFNAGRLRRQSLIGSGVY